MEAKAKMFLEKDGRRKCLNVGSGVDYKPSDDASHWVNADPNPATEPDIVCAAEELSSNFEADTFDEVHLIHVWEHCEDLLKVMEEIWCVMKPGGKLVVVVPFWTAENAFADPTHKHVITPITFAFLCYPVYEGNARTQSHMSQLFPECDFDIKRRAIIPIKDGDKFKDEEFAARHYLNAVEELQVELEAVKPIRRFDIKKYQTRNK